MEEYFRLWMNHAFTGTGDEKVNTLEKRHFGRLPGGPPPFFAFFLSGPFVSTS